VLVRTDPVRMAVEARAGWQAETVSFDQLVMAYLQRSHGAATTADPEPSKAAT
jgi:hypothetical protein